MAVGGYGAPRPHRVSRLERGAQVGVEVVGPTRTTRWWFTPGQLVAQVEVGESKHDLHPRN
jgi:hypothetical protein